MAEPLKNLLLNDYSIRVSLSLCEAWEEKLAACKNKLVTSLKVNIFVQVISKNIL